MLISFKLNNMINNVHDDLFFKPKNIRKRDEEVKKHHKELLMKVKLDLQNMKMNYENKNWESEEEKLFLLMFHKYHLVKEYDKNQTWQYLQDENNIYVCCFNCENNNFYAYSKAIWPFFTGKSYDELKIVRVIIEFMMQKHFKFSKFIVKWLM